MTAFRNRRPIVGRKVDISGALEWATCPICKTDYVRSINGVVRNEKCPSDHSTEDDRPCDCGQHPVHFKSEHQ